MKDFHTPPAPFNPDCIIDHQGLSKEVTAEMERLEESHPLSNQRERAERYQRVYAKCRLKYKTRSCR